MISGVQCFRRVMGKYSIREEYTWQNTQNQPELNKMLISRWVIITIALQWEKNVQMMALFPVIQGFADLASALIKEDI